MEMPADRSELQPIPAIPPPAAGPAAEITIVPVAAEPDRQGWSKRYEGADLQELSKLKERLCGKVGDPYLDIRDVRARKAVAEVALHIIGVEGPVRKNC